MTTILARTLLLTGASLIPAIAGNQILLRNLNLVDGTPALLADGSNGQLYVVAVLTSNLTGQQVSRVVEVDSNGSRLASIDLPQLPSPAAAMVDSQGNLIVAGKNEKAQGTVLKLDPLLQNAATVISLPAMIHAVALDASGNIYLTGATGATAFPVTAGAYQTKPPSSDAYGSALYAFLTEVSPAGQILYSTYFGSDTTICFGGSYCMGKFGVTTGTAIALDASGAVVIAGTTTDTALPTTPGVIAPTCVCGYDLGYPDGNAGFVAKFQPGAAQQLLWSTYLNATFDDEARSLAMNSMALDSAGDVVVGGNAPPGLPVTTSAFQIPGVAFSPGDDAFLLKLNSSGTAVMWGAYYGVPQSAVSSIFVDAQGRVVFSGQIGSFTFAARAAGDGSTLSDFYPGPAAEAGFDAESRPDPLLGLTSTGGLACVFYSGALWIETAAPGPSLLDVANSATGQYSAIASAELVSLYGIGIGPPAPVAGEVQNGVYTSSLAGYQVLFNGVAAPLLYADSGQINAVVPGFAGAPNVIPIQLVTPAGTVDGPSLSVTQSPVDGVFQNGHTGLAAALNQDGSINSPSNPANAGSIVSVFVNAFSEGSYSIGAVAGNGIVSTALPVSVFDADGAALNITFAGYAPGLVDSVMQINFQLPDPLSAGSQFGFFVQIGGPAGPLAPSQIAVPPHKIIANLPAFRQ